MRIKEQKSSSHILPPKDAKILSARQQNIELDYLLDKFSKRVKFLKVDSSIAQEKKKYENTSLLNWEWISQQLYMS